MRKLPSRRILLHGCLWIIFLLSAGFAQQAQTAAQIVKVNQTGGTQSEETAAPQVLKAPPEPVIIPNHVIIKFKTPQEYQEYQTLTQEVGLRVYKMYSVLNIMSAEITTGKNVQEVIAECQKFPQVEYAEPDYKLFALETPDDPDFDRLWGLNNIGQTGGVFDADIDAPEAWDRQKGSKQVLVAIIDTGIDYNHPDLQVNMWRNPGEIPNNQRDDDNNGFVDDVFGWDFANNDADPMDDNIHGTHVSGTVGAVGNNNRGVVGVNWQVSLMALKFLSSDGSGSTSDAVDAIIYGANNGANIMNNSWGGGGFSQALKDAIEYAQTKGVLFVAAAGNESRDTDQSPNYPSNYELDNVVSVAASTDRDNLASFSNFGKKSVDLAAPGENIYSTTPGNRYQSLSGTSMATPHVAGAAALIWAEYLPNSNYELVKYRLFGAVDFVNSFKNIMVLEGRLNLNQALASVPLVAVVERPDDTNDTNGPYRVVASAVDDNSITSVALFYEMSGASTDSANIPMTAAGTYTFKADIPGAATNTTINFKVIATDNENNTTESRFFSFTVGEGTQPPGGGCCGAMAVELHYPGMDPRANTAMNWFLNLFIFISPPLFYSYLKKRKR